MFCFCFVCLFLLTLQMISLIHQHQFDQLMLELVQQLQWIPIVWHLFFKKKGFFKNDFIFENEKNNRQNIWGKIKLPLPVTAAFTLAPSSGNKHFFLFCFSCLGTLISTSSHFSWGSSVHSWNSKNILSNIVNDDYYFSAQLQNPTTLDFTN